MTDIREFTSLELERLVQRYEGAVRGVARRYSVEDHALDELFQEVRVRLWRSLKTPDRLGTTTAGYVRRVARSAVIDQLRRNRARASEVTLHDGDAVDEPASEAGDLLELEELERTLSEALEELVPARRPVVRMHLAGYSRGDIESLLGWSEAKVRNLLYRGLAELREALGRRGFAPRGHPSTQEGAG